MAIDILCPEGHKLRVPDSLAGKNIRCPKCSTVFLVPGFDVDDAVQPIADDLVVEPIRSKKKKPKAEVEEEAALPAVSLSRAQLSLAGAAWLGSVLVAGFVGAMLGGRGPAPEPNPSVATAPNALQTGSNDALSDSSARSPASQASGSVAEAEKATPVAETFASEDAPGNPPAGSGAHVGAAPGPAGVREDLQAAVKLLDDGEYRLFIHEMLPEMEARLNRNPAMLDRIDKKELAEIRAHLLAAAGGEFKLNRDETFAEVNYVLRPIRTIENQQPPSVPPLLDAPKTAVPGLGSDLQDMLNAAADLLEKQPADQAAIRTFIESVYPLAEIALLQQGNGMDRLVHRILAAPAMRETMIGDLREAARANSVLDEQRRVATVELPPAVDGDPQRIFKFELTDGHWRFFDGAKNYRREIHRLASAPLRPFTVAGARGVITLKKIDGRWKLSGQPVVLPIAE